MYYKRTLEDAILQASDQFPVLLITGPRQVGKTTMLQHLCEKDRRYITLDDLTIRILAGIFDRHPNLKLVCPHVGGTLPYLIGRIDHQVCVLKRMNLDLKKPPGEYLRHNVYLDTVNVLPTVIRFGYDYVGADRLLFATDHPWVEADITVNNLRSLNLPPEDEAKIMRDNAKKLFKL